LDFDIQDIQRILPHRYPFLLVDKIIEVEPGKRIVGQKIVDVDELFFKGHFPGRAIMPGMLILEAIAQLGGVLCLPRESAQKEPPFLTRIQRARFRRPVVPGDVLTITVTLTRLRGNVGWAKGQARVKGILVCDMAFSFSIACAP